LLKSDLGGIEIISILLQNGSGALLKSDLGGIEIHFNNIFSFNIIQVKIRPWRD